MKTYRQMTDAEVKKAAEAIVRSSSSDDDIQRRLREEMGYPYGNAAIHSLVPDDQIGREARSIVAWLGGLIRKDGAMVMMMLYGPSGRTISL